MARARPRQAKQDERCDYLLNRRAASCEELAEAGLVGGHGQRSVRLDDDEKVHAGRNIMPHEAKGLAEAAFDEIALDGVAAAGADGDAEA